MKFKLDSLPSHTTKFLEILNNHLNIYKKPDENLISVIDSFVRILIDAIESDSSKLSQLKQCFENVKDKLSPLKDYLGNIITNFHTPNRMQINSVEIYYRSFFMNMYRVLKVKLKEFSEKVKPLYNLLQETITILSNPIEIDLYNPSILKCELQCNKNYLDTKYKSILDELRIFMSLENIQYIQQVKSKLCDIKSQISSLSSTLSTQNDILSKFYQYYVEQMVPTKTEDDKVATYSTNEGSKPNIVHANKEKLNELQIKCERDLESLKTFISNYTNHIKEFDKKLKEPCGCIGQAIQKVDETKSEFNKQKLIEYIINLIDTINFIISVEPSKIVEHLKPIYSIKPELESIITSIRCIDIQSDIFNLQNLCSKMIDTKSFNTNMKKLKEYISSVESHLGGTDQIVKSLRNIQKIFSNINPLRIISHHLEILIEEISKDNSKLPEDDPVKKYMDEMKKYTYILYYHVSKINENINKIEPLISELKKGVKVTKSEIKCLRSDIMNLECAIEGVARNFIRCSLQSFPRHRIKNNITMSNVY